MVSNTYITFSDLTPIATIESGDLFAVTDVSTAESASITFENLQNSVLSTTAIENNVDEIISAINSYDDGSGTNGLNATTLGANDRTVSYLLNYNNHTNKPTIPSNLSDLTNNTGFIRYDSSTSPPRLIYQNNEGGGSTTLITTTNVREGTNLYYTDDRVEDYFDSNFASYLSLYVATFDDGNTKDSLLDTAGTFQNISVSQSNTILVDSSVISNYSAGQSIRVYGASTNDTAVSLSSTFTVTNVNFDTTGDANTSPRQFSYKIAEFDFETGDISPSSSASSVEIGIPTLLSDSVNDVTEAFNATYFILLNFSSVPIGKGLLVYRSVGTVSGPVSGTYKLMAVLGPKEINAGQYIDYYTFDYNSWSGKNASDNTYSSIIHFPLTPPVGSRRGWVDVTIDSVNTTDNEIQLTDFVYVNTATAGACVLSHNDTATIQNAINSNSTAGRKTITLNAKTYVSDNLSIPDNFSITGVPNISKIRRLPWSGYTSLSSNIITSSSGSATNVSLVGFDIDGTLPNQFLYRDGTGQEEKNYAVYLGDLTSGCLIDRVRINNVIGGGVWNTTPSEFRFLNSEVVSSASTDRYDYSPLVAYDGSNIVVNNNRFQDFTQYVDVSTTNKGVVTNNIVSNCGSGIFVYGSTYLVSSPNVLTGPGNEFLPSPDILNSEYDSVNIDLGSAFLADTGFTSDTFVYQENGNFFDLTQNSGFIYYDVFLLQKLPNGAEEIYDNNVTGITGITLNEKSGLDKTVGQFGFNISKVDVEKIKLADGEFSYSSLSANNENHVGIAWSASYEQYVPAGTVLGTGTANNNVYSITIRDMEYISVGSLVKFDGHTGFSVDNSYVLNSYVANGYVDPSQIGTVLTVDTVSNESNLTIQFDGATSITEGTGGTINIVDRFVLAQGRIL